MDWEAFSRSIPNALSITQSNEVRKSSRYSQLDRYESGIGKLPINSSAYDNSYYGNQTKQNIEFCFVWQTELRNLLLWAGKRSLEIYMIHGLLLNIFKSSEVIQFSNISGYMIAIVNCIATIGFCALVIELLSRNKILKKILSIR